MRDFFDKINEWIYRAFPMAIVISWFVCVVYLVRGLITGEIK